MSAALSVRDLACGYPSRTVLEHVTFDVMAGEVVALLGPNGCGKTTLLKCVSGTLPVARGQVLVQGADLGQMNHMDRAKEIGFVPQEELPTFPFLARQIVVMGRLPHTPGFFDAPSDWVRVKESMIQADCWDLADRPVTELSGGERQRVLIARALATDATLLLLDEPSSHLDVGHTLGLVALLRQFADAGQAVMLAVHDLNLAAMVADRAILLGNGEVRAVGPTADVLRSSELDQVYGVDFERMQAESGQLRVFARA